MAITASGDAEFGQTGTWSARTLDVCRVSAIAAAVLAPFSTAATSIVVAVFLISFFVSGAALHVVSEAFRLPANKGILAFFAILLGSAFLNEEGLRVALADLWSWRKLAFLYVALPLFAAEIWKRRLMLALFWAFVPMLALSYISLAGWIPDRIPGMHGVILTNYSAQGIAFSVGALCGALMAWRTTGSARWVYAAISVAFGINVLFFGAGRTGYLALAGIVVVAAILNGGWRATLASLLGLALLAALAFAVSPIFKSRLLLAWNEMEHAEEARTETSIGIRVIFAKNAVALIAERPLLGYGLGSFKRVYADYVRARYTGVKATPAGDPHNQYLYVLFEQGALGLIVFFAMIASLFATFPRDDYGRMAACILAAWCLTSVFSSHFRTFPEGHFYAFVVAGFGAARGREIRRQVASRNGASSDVHNVHRRAASREVLEYSST